MLGRPTTERAAASETPGGSEPGSGPDTEKLANEPAFPTLPEAAVRSVSSNVRKAQVRAALFRTLEPVRVGRFILLERLGGGAMGEIYAAYDEQLDRRVALKLVRHGSELTAKADELLLREAQALAQVSHPNVVQIYEAGAHDGRLFIAMELIRGQTLTAWLSDVARMSRPQRQREILRRFIAAGRGLEAAHAAGVAHRDFKPDNVLVGDDGRVRVVDFGLARALVDVMAPGAPAGATPGAGLLAMDEDFAHGRTMRMDTSEALVSGTIDTDVDKPASRPISSPGSEAPRIGQGGEPDASASGSGPKLTAATRLTETGIVMGTPRFMAPEQIRGAIADHRSDQFSFCVALYHALYGEFPFAGERMQELLDSMESRAIDLEHGVGLAARVRNALRRGLSVDPSQRFASMGELLAALEPGLRRKGGWIAGAVLLLVVAAVVYFRPVREDPCARAGDGIDSAWSAERQVAMQAAFLRSDLPYAEAGWRSAKQRLDRYASRWGEAATAACRATYIDHVQSAQQLDRRMLCLERGRNQFAALTSELAGGAQDATQRAVAAAESLSDLDACNHTENMLYGLEPPPAQVAGEVAEVREQLARALTLERLGRTEESLVLARKARVATERLKYPAVHAEALFHEARALDARDVADARSEAQGLYFEALDIAEAERHDQLAAEIWNRLVLLAIRTDAGMQQAHAWWRRDAAAIRRIGGSALAQARLHHLLGEIYYRETRFAEAVDEENRAIAELAGTEQPLELSRYYDALGKALWTQDRIDEAILLHERALAIATEALGPSHPDVIKLKTNYGNALRTRGRFDRARAVLEDALASMPVTYRESHFDAGKLHSFLSDLSYVEGKLDEAARHARTSLEIYQRGGAREHKLAEAYISLANVESARKNFAAALAMYEHALALRRPHLGSDHFQLGVNEGSIADTLVELGRYDEAMPHLREAERILERSAPKDRATRAWILTVHGELLVRQHRLDAALPVLEQALPLFEGTSDNNEPRAKWALAQALHGLQRDPARVRQLAEQARAMFDALGAPEARNRDTVERFIERLIPVPASPSPRPGHGTTR